MNDDDKVIQMILYHTQDMRTCTLLNDELRKIIMSDRHRPTSPVAQTGQDQEATTKAISPAIIPQINQQRSCAIERSN
jgi:hypothetical protein